jgi:hypothetical protein
VADIGDRGGRLPGLGAPCDHDVGVVGALGLAVGQAALQDCPVRRIHRDRVRPLSQPDRLVDGIEIGDAQVADLLAGGSVEQCQDAQQRLVRVNGRFGGPAAEMDAAGSGSAVMWAEICSSRSFRL